MPMSGVSISESVLPDSEYYQKTRKGLWIGAKSTVAGIDVFWQKRTVYRNNCFQVIGPDDEVISEHGASEMEYGDPWVTCGTITVGGEMLEMSGAKDLDWFLHGLMRHAVHLICECADHTPKEILGWFDDLLKADFIVAGNYKMVGPEREPFVGLKNADISIVNVQSDSIAEGTIAVLGNKKYDFFINDNQELVAFIIGSIPVA